MVSYDDLLANVWPNTVVTPNTLQKSIAQLRKVLRHDSNSHLCIKTHAKQGYSLEWEVKWHDETTHKKQLDHRPNTQAEAIAASEEKLTIADGSLASDVSNARTVNDTTSVNDTASLNEMTITTKTHSSRSFANRTMLVVSMVILVFIGVSYFTPKQSLTLSFGELRPLTATDNKESSASYSPDGNYIVFKRYSEDICESNNIWARHTQTQKETQLTKDMGGYGGFSLSKDGKKLVFIKAEYCNQPITQKNCYQLMSLDFEKALETPQSPTVLMECKNTSITSPTWLNNNDIALLQESANRWQLISYSIADNMSTVIYSHENGNFVDYDYSAADDLIALTNIHDDGQNYIEILKPNGQLLSSHQIEYPPEITNLRRIYPNFTPYVNQLIFSTGRQLFTLSYQGKITNISLPMDEPLGTPLFHPVDKRALVIKGNWDSDIAMLSLSDLTLSNLTEPSLTTSQTGQVVTKKNHDVPIANLAILERSTLEDESASYQPQGKLIGFKSRRSGEEQIWVADGNSAQQFSFFPIDSYINGWNWAVDGQSMLVNVNNTLVQLMLNSSQTSFPFEHKVEQLFQWNSENNAALLTARIKGELTFGELNLTNLTFRVITDKKINRALKSEDGRLIYTDQLDRFWQPGPAEDQLIELLTDQGSDKGFIIKDNIIYGINEAFQLWSYRLNENTIEILGELPSTIESITDINQSNILLTTHVTAKKEVAELVLRE